LKKYEELFNFTTNNLFDIIKLLVVYPTEGITGRENNMIKEEELNCMKDIDWSNRYSNWKDWKWQVKNAVRDIDTLEKLLGIRIDEKNKKNITTTIQKFPMSITPYYLSLIDVENYENDPVFKQAVPTEKELIISRYDMADPLAEDKDSPVKGITHRYPDRVLFHISNVCAMYCRHCTRKRKVGDVDHIPNKEIIKKGLNYIRDNTQIRDVLLSGGDPFLLSDEYLDWVLTELRSIPHVEVIRIGTRVPVVLPYRVTEELVQVLKKHHPLWINTHFNHPREITESSKEAIRKLADAGIPLGNQSVLLAGVNDCPNIMKKLVQKLVQNRVRPYYIYQCDMAEGLSHFRTPVGKGIEIMEALRGHTSGFAIPTYVVDAPGGGGKIPVMPNYLVSWSHNKVVLRNYEGVITTYKEPDNYKTSYCNLNCDDCHLTLKLDEAKEVHPVGIERLLSDYDKAISFTPSDNERVDRRYNE
jgi:lysine 2,3-aminomutase